MTSCTRTILRSRSVASIDSWIVPEKGLSSGSAMAGGGAAGVGPGLPAAKAVTAASSEANETAAGAIFIGVPNGQTAIQGNMAARPLPLRFQAQVFAVSSPN